MAELILYALLVVFAITIMTIFITASVVIVMLAKRLLKELKE